MKVGIQRGIARRLEQLSQQTWIVSTQVLLVEINDEHAVVALAGEFMLGITRHQTGTHAGDLTTRSVHLELGTAR